MNVRLGRDLIFGTVILRAFNGALTKSYQKCFHCQVMVKFIELAI